MKILLINECSNLHTTLSEGLKQLGHEVTTISGGNGWRNYPRDISIVRKSSSHLDGIFYIAKLYSLLPKLKGYDVVQINNPIFFSIKAERHFFIYDYLRKHNRSMFLGAFGTDYYWVKTCLEEMPLKYSDHNIGDTIREYGEGRKDKMEWLGTQRERLNKYIAKDCDGIIPCLYEYWICYKDRFPQKTRFIPLPIKMPERTQNDTTCELKKIRIFIGIDKERNEYKGTDIMYQAAKDIYDHYPDRCEIIKAENVPFAQYQHLMDNSDLILDQLYSYTPAMNALLAMSKGIIAVSGGEPENYEILNEKELRPIINVKPTYESVYDELEQLILHPERIPELKRQSIEYVRRHHDYVKVARQYEQFYKERIP